MSAHAAAPKTVLTRLVQAAVLVSLFAVLFGATRLMPHGTGNRGSVVAATGFLLVAGTLLSELVEVVRLPHLSGYLFAGVLAGPYLLGLIDHETVTELSSINTLALALIALEGGAELKLDALRQGLKSLVVSTLFQSVPVLLLMAGVFIAARPLVPFLRELSPSALVGAGLLWGAVAISRSPSATLGILSQTRAAGPLARYTLTFVMTSDVVVVVLVAVTALVARPLIEPATELLAARAHHPRPRALRQPSPWAPRSASRSRRTSGWWASSSAWCSWRSASAPPRCSCTCASTRC